MPAVFVMRDVPVPTSVSDEAIDADGVRVFVITPMETDPLSRHVYLHVHEGSFAFGGGEACRLLSIRYGAASRCDG